MSLPTILLLWQSGWKLQTLLSLCQEQLWTSAEKPVMETVWDAQAPPLPGNFRQLTPFTSPSHVLSLLNNIILADIFQITGELPDGDYRKHL